jgi:hypothetical protein
LQQRLESDGVSSGLQEVPIQAIALHRDDADDVTPLTI